MKKIIIIIDYFGGAWPEWIDLYFLSCQWNPSVNWLIHTDCPCDKYQYSNVVFSEMSWEEYKCRVGDRLQIEFNPQNYYKLCDIRPALGYIWEEEIEGYDFYGYGDLDVIYGNLRKFLSSEVLKHNIVSTHEWCFSGHLSLFKNEGWMRNSFRKLSNWRIVFENQSHYRFDEDYYFRVFIKPNRFTKIYLRALVRVLDLINPFRIKFRNIYLKEQYSTPLVPGLWRGMPINHSDTWFWRDGCITNDSNGGREFMYLHFMNFVSARYMDTTYGLTPPWAGLKKVVNISTLQAEKGFSIGLNGFGSHDVFD